ncbi:MAG TPA: hypothetical protein VEI53_10860 [Ktedonobacteraceae bacterium]|nr:hypothetical protein [Ktedonobacteraceae bacterium]
MRSRQQLPLWDAECKQTDRQRAERLTAHRQVPCQLAAAQAHASNRTEAVSRGLITLPSHRS